MNKICKIFKSFYTIGTFSFFLIWSMGVWGQTTFSWRGEATNGNWNDVNNWWNGSGNSTAGFGILFFDNGNQLTMNNNFSTTFNTHALRFNNNSVRTIGGNAVRLFDNGGAFPYIQNNSTGTHILNFNLEGDGDAAQPILIQINNTGGFTFGGTINNRGSDINIGGTRSISGTNVTINGVISGSGGLFKTNSNIVAVFNAPNTFTGLTTIEAGTLRLGQTGASFGGVTSAVQIGANGVLDLNGFNTTVRYISERGTGDAGILTLGSGTLTIADDGSTTRFQSSINGTGNIIYNSSSTSVMNLFNSQGWSGTTTVQGGTLTSSGAMQTSSITISGGTFRTTGSNNRLAVNPPVNITGGTFNPQTNETISSLTGTGGTVSINTGNTLTINNAVNNEYAGVIAGAGGLTKDGSGILSLTNQNTYTGTTTINTGELNLNRLGGGTLAATNNVTVNNTATLRVSTSQTLNNLSVASGATLLVPAGITLTINGTLTINSNFLVEGSIVFGPNASVNIRTGGTFTNLAGYWPVTSGPIGVTLGNSTSLTLDGIRTLSNLNIESGSTLVLNNNNLTISAGGTLTNAGTLTVGTGKVIFAGAATISGSSNIQFGDVDISGGVDFGSISTLNGELRINPNGFILTNPPAYASGSTLRYNTEGIFERGAEWPSGTTNVPHHVIINSNLSMGAHATGRQLNGDLTIQSSRTLTLSSQIGGDLLIRGNWLNQGTFNANDRAVFFNGTTPQTIQNNQSGGISIPFLFIQNDVTAISNMTVNNRLDIANDKQFTIQTGKTLTFQNVANLLNNNGTLNIEGSLTDNRTSKTFGGTVRYTAPSGTQAVVGGTYINLELSGSGAKEFASTPSVAGNFVVSGTSTVTPPAQFNFNGATPQSIAGLAYNNIQFSGAGAKAFTSNGSLGASSTMSFVSGSGAIDFDGSSNDVVFTLLSDATGTATIANTNGVTLNGRVTAQRYFGNTNKRAWRLITAPVAGTGSIFSNWQTASGSATGVLIWGPGGNPADNGLQSGPNASMRGWDNANGAFVNVSNTLTTNLSDASDPKGYFLFVSGPASTTDINAPFAPATVAARGTLLQGNYTFSISTPVTNRFYLVPNPFASPVNHGNGGGLTMTNTTNQIWIWDPNLSGNFGVGGYVSFDRQNNTYSVPVGNSATGLGFVSGVNYTRLQSGQAFFVQAASNPSGALTVAFTEATKGGTSVNLPFRMSSSTSEKMRVTLQRNFSGSYATTDGAVAFFYTNANAGVDDMDGVKLINAADNLMFRRGTSSLTFEHRPPVQQFDTLFLNLSATSQTGYRLLLEGSDFTTSAQLGAWLQDTYLNTETMLNLSGTTSYDFAVDANAASTGQRFRIVFRNSVVTPVRDLDGLRAFSIYPNPVQQGGQLSLEFRNRAAGKYTVTVFNLLGMQVQQGVVTHGGGTAVQTLRLNSGLAAGNYVVEVTDDKGNRMQQKISIQ